MQKALWSEGGRGASSCHLRVLGSSGAEQQDDTRTSERPRSPQEHDSHKVQQAATTTDLKIPAKGSRNEVRHCSIIEAYS